MADIELVIKLSEEEYKYIIGMQFCILGIRGGKGLLNRILNAIRAGTPLPKGHGRIGDLDALRCENTDFDTYNDYCTMFDEIEATETIIEADKEEA